MLSGFQQTLAADYKNPVDVPYCSSFQLGVGYLTDSRYCDFELFALYNLAHSRVVLFAVLSGLLYLYHVLHSADGFAVASDQTMCTSLLVVQD